MKFKQLTAFAAKFYKIPQTNEEMFEMVRKCYATDTNRSRLQYASIEELIREMAELCNEPYTTILFDIQADEAHKFGYRIKPFSLNHSLLYYLATQFDSEHEATEFPSGDEILFEQNEIFTQNNQ